jgi:hypothetical protein
MVLHGQNIVQSRKSPTYVVARESLSFQDNLELLLVRSVEAGHHQVQICSQRLHDGNLAGLCTNEWGQLLCCLLIKADESMPIDVVVVSVMAIDTLHSPCLQMFADIIGGALRLQSQRVATQIYTRGVIGGAVLSFETSTTKFQILPRTVLLTRF